MHMQASRRDSRLVAIADDDHDARGERVRALEAAGWQVVATGIDGCAEIAAAGGPCALVISVTTDAAVQLLRSLSREPQTSEIPVIVPACDSEQTRTKAEQAGSVVIFLERPSPATVVAAVREVLGLREGADGTSGEVPAWCPQCSARTGVPRSVSTATPAATYIGLECPPCGQRWRVRRAAAPSATPLL
jgi:response regulator RpfG family c-di-GMP phosphodiesterase